MYSNTCSLVNSSVIKENKIRGKAKGEMHKQKQYQIRGKIALWKKGQINTKQTVQKMRFREKGSGGLCLYLYSYYM